MSSDRFLFTSLGSKRPLTIRQMHIRRLYDLLQLCIQRHDYERAEHAWAILARCKEVNWKSLWPIALIIKNTSREPGQDVEFLRTMMLQHPDERQAILKELVFRLLLANKCREALDELELYLPSFPYQDDPVLHIYAGLCALYLACDKSGINTSFHRGLLRAACVHIEHARILDPENLTTQTFLDKINDLQNGEKLTQNDTDDDDMALEDTGPYKKRSRT